MHLKKICPIQNFSLGVCTQIQMIVSKPYFSFFFFFFLTPFLGIAFL